MKRIITSLFIILVLLGALSCSKGKETDKPVETGKAVKGEDGYTYKITSGSMEFSWSIAGNNLHAKVKGKTSGWVSAGFNPTDGMKDGNFIMGFVKDGKAELSNHVGTSKFLHKNIIELGGRNHIMNPSGALKDNMIEITFDYPLTTGDKFDRPIIVNGDTVLLLAMASTSFISQQHMFRSKINVNLSNGSYTVISSSGK